MKKNRGKLIIFSAPSGSGKTTIVRELMKYPDLNLAFSVSAASRPKRTYEKDGVDYYFISPEEFRKKIENNEFIEWEEVYPGHFYGTLKEEVMRLMDEGKNVIFDIDVKGGMNIKKLFPDRSLSVFVQVPDQEALEKRLKNRKTEDEEKIKLRLSKAREEMQFAPQFDIILLNDQLDRAVDKAYELVKRFVDEK